MKPKAFHMLFHPNKLKRQNEREAEQAFATITQLAATQEQELTQIKQEAISLLNTSQSETMQNIAAEYNAALANIEDEYAAIVENHNECLAGLSYMFIYGRAIIFTEYLTKQDELNNAMELELKDIPEDSFLWRTIFGTSKEILQQQQAVQSKYEALNNALDAEMQQRLEAFTNSYYDDVENEQQKMAAFEHEHQETLKQLDAAKAVLNQNIADFYTTQLQNIEDQYQLNLTEIRRSVKDSNWHVQHALKQQLDNIRRGRRASLINIGIMVGGATFLWYLGPTIVKTLGYYFGGSINFSVGVSILTAADSLINGDSKQISFNVTMSFGENPSSKAVAPPPFATEPRWEPQSNKEPYYPPPRQYEPWNYDFGLTTQQESWNITGREALFGNQTASDWQYNYDAPEFFVPQSADVVIGKPEIGNSPVNMDPFYGNQGVPQNIQHEASINPPPSNSSQPSAFSGFISSIKIGWDAFLGKQTPEVLAWQENNRNQHPNLAAFSDGINNSKTQKVVNAFSDGAVDGASGIIMFAAEEAERIRLREETKTVQFIRKVNNAVHAAGAFIDEEVARINLGHTTQTSVFFDEVITFAKADFNRLRSRQATVIGTLIEREFNALKNMSAEELAYSLGHEAGSTLFLLGAGKVVHRAATLVNPAMKSASLLAKSVGEYVEANSPLVFSFEAGRLNSGFPFDAVKLRNRRIIDSADKSLFANSKANMQAEYLRRNYELQKIFTPDGKLAPEVLSGAKDVQDVLNFKESSPVYKALLSRGDIENWKKYSYKFKTNTMHEFNGSVVPLEGEVHFYMNAETKEVFYDRDYKVKLKLPNQPMMSVQEFLDSLLKGTGDLNDCKMQCNI